MTTYLYTHGLDGWGDFETADHTWLLLQTGYTLDRDHQFIADVAAQEITVAGYARQAGTGETRTVNLDQDRIVYTIDAVTFAGLATGQTVRWVVFATVGTSDADSLLLCATSVTDTDTAEGALTFTLGDPGLHQHFQW